jgi:hypothetical protein
MNASFVPAWAVIGLAAVACSTAPALAQSPSPRPEPTPAEVALLRDEVARLREEVAAMRSALQELRLGGGQTQKPQPPPGVTAEAFEILRAQVEEHAQTKVESSSRLPVKFSGTILVNTFVNSGEVNWMENPNLVNAPPAGTGPTGSMSVTARQSRFGIDASGIMIGGWQASGSLIADFLGGIPNFQTGTVMGLPRLIYAFGRIETERTAIQVGQDHTLLAPRDPTSLAALSFPLFFRSGNLYLRAPQVRVEQTLGAWNIAAGIVAPIAGDMGTTYDFAPPPGNGERSRRPAFEARASFAHGGDDSNASVSAGVAMHYGWRRNNTALNESWAVAADVDARVGRVGFAAELYTADNSEAFGGALSQPGPSSGGWAEGRLSITPRTRVAAGYAFDTPEDALGRVPRLENRSAFSNVIFDVTPEVGFSVEYRWLRTRYAVAPTERSSHHLNAAFAIRF